MKLNNNLVNYLSDEQIEEVQNIQLDDLEFFEDQPFNIYDKTEKFNELIESIKDYGIINPLIVTNSDVDNKYVILSGRHRYLVAKELGYETIPCIVKLDLSEEEKYAYVIETNVTLRSFLEMSLMEQAKTLKYKNDKYKKIKFNEETKNTRQRLAKEYNISSSKVYRLMKLNDLIEEFQIIVNENNINIDLALLLANLDKDKQKYILKKYELKKIKFTKKDIEKIITEDLFNDKDFEKNFYKDKKDVYIKIKLSDYEIKKFENKTKKEIEEYIHELLEN
ncbi:MULTISPECIES: ParB/RepB/Spo0J family partition protein [Helcococcus]|uniref:ParB N-terminal domain-containing protein n=1 Tax=Helcococcus bovis TaxID=3153252 RepID=A0ABW9F5U3_9FIRM